MIAAIHSHLVIAVAREYKRRSFYRLNSNDIVAVISVYIRASAARLNEKKKRMNGYFFFTW